MPKTLYEKIWEAHAVREAAGEPTILYIDTHLIHEVTSPQAFAALKARGLRVRRPDLTVATMDHSVPSINRERRPWPDRQAESQVNTLAENCHEQGIKLYDLNSPVQGIVHVIGPELGLTRPGRTIVCGDSHTSTHGAFGALAFGIGTSEVEQVFATQCLLQNKTKSMAITVTGSLPRGVYAKDLILKIIQEIGVGGGTGYTLEYRGQAISELSMEGRMSVCNMSIEAGARAGLIAPDQTTVDYLKNKVEFRNPDEREKQIEKWLAWQTDAGARFDKEVELNGSEMAPMVTWGTNPAMSTAVDGRLPTNPDEEINKALEYMGFKAGQKIEGQSIDYVFIGSCTNSRIEDLRAAAGILRGKKVSPQVRALIVPGSQAVMRQAELEGLRDIFVNANCEWREPGCSMCIAMNGDIVPAGKYCASTSNRNFVGRQGKGARTLLVSPAMAAFAATLGKIGDVRNFL